MQEKESMMHCCGKKAADSVTCSMKAMVDTAQRWKQEISEEVARPFPPKYDNLTWTNNKTSKQSSKPGRPLLPNTEKQ